MPVLRWSLALTAALVLAGCKRDEPTPSAPADSTPKASPTASPTPPTPSPSKQHGATGVGTDTPAALPPPPGAASSALSFLKPVDPEKCDWVRQPLPSGEPVTVYTFGAACDRSMVSFSPDGKEGLLFTWPSGEGEVPKAWRVDLAKRTGKPLELKGLPGATGAGGQDQPYIEQIGFDKQGRPVAIVADVYVTRQPKKGPKDTYSITFEGKSYPLPEVDGSAGLAHAFQLEGEAWKRIETKGSRFESDIAPGTRELEAARAMVTVWKGSPPERLVGEDAPESVVKLLNAAFPGQDESGGWMGLKTPGGNVYYQAMQGGEFLYSSAPVRWEQDGKLVELEDLAAKPGDSLGFQVKDEWLLIANYGESRGAQVWDTRTKKRMISVEGASAPAFWP
jgi:hypothetical protein